MDEEELSGIDSPTDEPSARDGPPPLPSPPAIPTFRLTERERAIASELERIDPQLSGLFQLGMELVSRDDVPGISYLIAEAGRELNVGVVNALAADAPELSASDLVAIDPFDRYRASIARALRLPPRHPLVDAWAEMNRRFNGEAHLVANRTDVSPATSDFKLLTGLLLGRLAPYFDAQDEADALLRIELPGEEHVEALRRILVRPALRTYFFRSLRNPGWLRPLMTLGAFRSPPPRTVHADGSWSLATWLEGEFLARVAGAEPAAVAELLRAVPTDNDNPAVWDVVARAAAALPPELAASVLPRLVIGIRSVPRVVLPKALIELAHHVAPVDVAAVVELANVLLWMRRRPPEREAGEAGDTEDDARAAARRRFSTAWLLERVDIHDAQQIIDELVPAIVAVNPGRGIEFLSQKLGTAMKGVDADAKEATPRSTTHWCRNFEGSDDGADVRAMFARPLARAAADLASRSEDDAKWVVSLLRALPDGIGRRILYFALSRCGLCLRDELNALISDPSILEWEMPGREVGEVLRRRFADASPEAQQAFVRVLERGPGQEVLDHYIQRATQTGRDDSPDAALAYWQQKHLRRFGPHLPQAVQPLAERIGFVPAQPSAEELALTEDGWYSGGAAWVTEHSPIETDRLRDTPPNDLARMIAGWVPESGIDRPTLRGLEDAVEEMAAAEPARGLALANALLREHETPRGVVGVLRGVRKAREAEREVQWDALQTVLDEALRGFPDAHAAEWRQVRATAIDLIDDVLVDGAPTRIASSLFSDVERLLGHPSTWEDDAPLEITNMDSVMSASLNTLAGRAVRALIRLGLREYQSGLGGEADNSERANEIRRKIGERLRTSITLVLEQRDRPAVGARASLGMYLPQLVWFDQEWWAERAETLVGQGIADPLGNPIWSAYLAGSRFFEQTFRAMRRWYAAAARRASSAPEVVGDRTWEPERNLIEHVLIAVVHGLVNVGDKDELVEQAVRNVPLDDLAHAYWTIFRWWSDTLESGEVVPADAVARLVRFWNWRVEQLEHEQESPRRSTEADALIWFCLTPFLGPADVLRLGKRTLAMAQGERGMLHSLWERLPELASADPNAAFSLMEQAVKLELGGPYPHLSVADLGPVFEIAFARGTPATRSAAVVLLNRLGDAGFSEFGRLRPR